MKYDWLMDGLYGDVDPQVAGEHIESLIEKHAGHLTTEEVLADARRSGSPIHGVFEWDENKAAEMFRRRQASAMLSGLVIKKKGKTKTRAFVYVQTPEHGRKTYVPIRSAMGRPELKSQVIDSALRSLRRWTEHYGGRTELSFVKNQVERLKMRIEAEYMTAAGLR